MCPVFHEQVPTMVLKALVECIHPKRMTVIGDFSIRGGLGTLVKAGYVEPATYGGGE